MSFLLKLIIKAAKDTHTTQVPRSDFAKIMSSDTQELGEEFFENYSSMTPIQQRDAILKIISAIDTGTYFANSALTYKLRKLKFSNAKAKTSIFIIDVY